MDDDVTSRVAHAQQILCDVIKCSLFNGQVLTSVPPCGIVKEQRYLGFSLVGQFHHTTPTVIDEQIRRQTQTPYRDEKTVDVDVVMTSKLLRFLQGSLRISSTLASVGPSWRRIRSHQNLSIHPLQRQGLLSRN
jgi:hypothetical protein